MLAGSQPVAANESHAILAFESNFNAEQTMKRDNLNTSLAISSVMQLDFHQRFWPFLGRVDQDSGGFFGSQPQWQGRG
ncbi:hypothetical protein HGP05_10000 [Streptococcus sanguinis]|uniref:Uncharacterized protein n=1 Tax=Streptococcus sanguinis TaxID=1305 RepID=A0A7Y0YS10_STRSA|nr:hypothetical protein [Streptococcus sanguinis]